MPLFSEPVPEMVPPKVRLPPPVFATELDDKTTALVNVHPPPPATPNDPPLKVTVPVPRALLLPIDNVPAETVVLPA